MTTALFHSFFLALAVLFATFSDSRADFNDGVQTEGDLINDNALRNDNEEISWWLCVIIVFLLIICASIIGVAYCFFCMKRHSNDTRCQGGIFRILYCGSIIGSVFYFFGCKKRNVKEVDEPGNISDNSTKNEPFQKDDIEFGAGKSVNSHSSNTENSPLSIKSIYSQQPKTWPQTVVTDTNDNDNDDNTIRSQRSIYSHDPASWQVLCNIENCDDKSSSEADSDDIRLLEILEEKYAEKMGKKRDKEERRSQRKLQKKSERKLQKKSERELQKKSQKDMLELQKKSKQALQKLSKRTLEAPQPPSIDESTNTEERQGKHEDKHPTSKVLISPEDGNQSNSNPDFYYVE